MITWHFKNIDVSEDDQQLMDKKIHKLFHLDQTLEEETAKVEVHLEENNHKSEAIFKVVAHVPHPPATLVAEGAAPTALAAIDMAEVQLRPQLEKHKAKRVAH